MENVGLSGGGTSSLLALAAELDAADDECDAAAFRNHLVRRIFSSEASGLLDEGLVAGRACLYDTRHLQQELDARAELASVTAELEAVRAEAASYEARATAAEKKLSALSSLPITREQHLTLTSGSSDAPVSAPSVLGAPSTSVPDVNTGHTSARLMDGAAPHPRDLIDSIRGSRLEAARSAGQLHALVDRALAALSRDLYSGQGHALSELLQNADDARYCHLAAGELPQMRVSVGGGALLVESNEDGFSEADVRSVCDLGSSTKLGRTGGSIGRKGLGFKSCFALSDIPHIWSRGFSFRFDVRAGLYGALVPEWILPDELGAAMRRHLRQLGVGEPLADGTHGTGIWLPLRSGCDLAAAPPLSLAPTALLFLRQLRLIERVHEQQPGWSVRRVDDASAREARVGGGAQTKPCAARVSLVVDDAAAVWQERRDFLLWKETHVVEGVATEVVLAFRVGVRRNRRGARSEAKGDGDDHPGDDGDDGDMHAHPGLDADLHAWLPVGAPIGLPFCAHSPRAALNAACCVPDTSTSAAHHRMFAW